MAVPLIGRLRAWEWPILMVSLFLVALESLIAFITYLLPEPVIAVFSALSKRILAIVPQSGAKELSSEPALKRLVLKVADAPGFVEICRIFGYDAEEHIVRTSDGYLLGLHRIGGPKGSGWRTQSRLSKPAVYLHHGLLMNSEIWVSVVDPRKSLPFVLADAGYDVWLGNNRGNKYSKKHVFREPSENAFWNFSIDDFALYDIPDTVDYILSVVKQKDLAYIGFSQGSAQGFASLSINPLLNSKIRLFIALAPAMAPPGLGNNIVDSLVRASPSLLYLFFGRKAILKSTTFWQSIMFPPLFVRTIDLSLDLLFHWKCKNITYAQKLASYAHLYSYTSVKSVVHWFQIIRSARFHMYDDEVLSPFHSYANFYKVAPFPTQNIVTPVVLIYGKSDSLVSIKTMLAELPPETAHVGINNHEHLDLIWGEHVDTLVFPYVFSALRRTNGGTCNPNGACAEPNMLSQELGSPTTSVSSDTDVSEVPEKATEVER
jgi:lysosomal acid lipase/cholesteryl ester hydrolase